ncbi:mannosyl-oligosaccharide glucosidase, partial [Mytilus galloprovincialis]
MAESGQTQLFRCKLVVLEVLTDILRDYMTHEGTAPKAIHKLVMNNKNLRHHFTSKELNVIQNLPSTGFKEFDISLMYKIAKTKLLALIIPDEPTHGWGSEPSPNEDTIGDNVMRIVNRRNELSHRKNATLLESEFKDFFEKFLDIGERAEKHLSRKDRSITSQIESDKTCCIDKDMEKKMDKLVRENEDLKSRVNYFNIDNMLMSDCDSGVPEVMLCMHHEQVGEVKVLVSEGTQTMIGCVQSRGSSEGTCSAELRMFGIENPTEKAKLVVKKKADINTDNISIKEARSGSLLIFLEIRNNLFKNDRSMEMEMKSFIDKLFDIAELKCSTYSQCNICLDIENDIDDDGREDYDDLVLSLDVQNSAFKTNESISQTFSQFISNVLTNMNGQHLKCKREFTAILDMTENEMISQFGQTEEAIAVKEEHGSQFGQAQTAIEEKQNIHLGHHQNNYMKKRKYLLIVFATIIVIVAVMSNHFYNSYLETIVVTPLDSPKINLNNSELFWGTYRSNLYFGMKTRSSRSPVIGLMWFEASVYEDAWQQDFPKIRHWCDETHNIPKYGWLKHDGNKFGLHEVVENTFMFNTQFVKRSGGTKGGDWTARITAWPK